MFNQIDVKVGKELFWKRTNRSGELVEAKQVEIVQIYKDGSFKVDSFAKPTQARFKDNGWPWAQSGSGKVVEIENGETLQDLLNEIERNKSDAKAQDEERERKAQQRFQAALEGTKDYTIEEVDKHGDETTYKLITVNERDNHRYLVIFTARPEEYYDYERGWDAPIVDGLRVSVSYRNTEEKNFNNWGSCNQFDVPNLESAIEQIRAHIWECW